MVDNPIVWSPDEPRLRASAMFRFMTAHGFRDYAALHRWSIDEPGEFWPALAEFCGLEFDRPAQQVLIQPGDMTTARWFEGGTLNFAANLLKQSDDGIALIFCGENGVRREVSYAELRRQVAGLAAGLAAAGVGRGDRVAGYVPNAPEAIAAMLATASLGAIWSSCSPDFGPNGVIDRFGQIEPKALFCADGYFYAGKSFDSLSTVREVLGSVTTIERVVVFPFAVDALPPLADRLADLPAVLWDDFIVDNADPDFQPLPFDQPLYIMYSSGTTGVPKCIVHGAGGTLLQHLKEHVLHCDVRRGDRLFYFTTCGWMMWNWLASGLASGATLVLFDGSPFHEDGRILWRIAERERIAVFGTSAKYIAAQEKAGIRPRQEFDLSALRCILSTGSPLAPASFDYVYQAVAEDVLLASISGGTDIISCFASGNPMLPVRRGEIQSLGLGMAVAVYDDAGKPVIGERGELVCTRAFPSMPAGFWDDPGDQRYHAAYFERFPGVWAHGDFAEITEHGGMIIHGRSDAVLNPGGVRIGTAEIYRQVEKLPEIIECIAIGQNWQEDVRVVLFVVLREGLALDDQLQARIRKVIRDNTTPRHVPAKIVAVPEIPRTRSGKIVELAVRSVVHDEPVRNTEALANPHALDYFRGLSQLSTE